MLTFETGTKSPAFNVGSRVWVC